MKKVCALVLLVCFGTAAGPGLVFADSAATPEADGYEPESWKKRIASPSYGLSLLPFTLESLDNDGDERTETIFLPGIDLRHFNGINVPRDGSFYYGYELGLSLNGSLGEHSFTHNGDNHTVENLLAAKGFLMVKHGYRMALGEKSSSPKIGFELGMGVSAGTGDITITRDEDDPQTNLAQVEESVISPLVEASLEGSLPRGADRCLVLRLGLTAGPPVLDNTGFGESVPVQISLRAGFTRNH